MQSMDWPCPTLPGLTSLTSSWVQGSIFGAMWNIQYDSQGSVDDTMERTPLGQCSKLELTLALYVEETAVVNLEERPHSIGHPLGCSREELDHDAEGRVLQVHLGEGHLK